MLIKLETKSARVKGLSFHPKRPWVLASLHNGTIQLWDYQVSTMIDKFDEHDGPVRGICFHMNQSLFVSGGDDYKVKVWNYKLRKCMFTLFGHLDYIRTTYFHHNYPWIVSASDDQTIRIWNWQSRNCLAMLTGHNHYVMCANFHPSEDLIVSASLDQTVRVWDIKGLRQKCVTPAPNAIEHHYRMAASSELFGINDVVVRLVLEGHDRGVNWAAFHPTLPLIVSGGDDRLVKLWRMNELKAWEVDTCRGHYNNVSCVLFHPRADLIISNSEDKSLRVWDMTKRTCLRTFRREHDRFWVMTVHPTLNVFAAGTDNGFLVFKLERERPVFAVSDHFLFYVKEKQIRQLDFKTSADTVLITTKLPARSIPFRIECNLYEKACLLTWHASNQESHNFEYISMPLAATNASAAAATTANNNDSSSEPRFKTNAGDISKGTGFVTVWLTRNRFAILDRQHNQLIVRNSKLELLKKIPLPKKGYDDMFFVGNGNILIRDAEEVVLFDVQQKRIEASVRVSKCKYVHWSAGQEYVALLSKNDITICNRQLETLCIVHENVRVKSGAWDRRNVFVYTTSNHIKYCLLNGDYGIIRTLDLPLYVTRVDDDRIYCLDREAKPCILNVDTTEYKFKWALVNRKYENVLEVVRNAKLIGQSIISYLQQKGYPEVALFFVKDNRIRFSLALDCGNLQVAMEAARALNDPQCWQRLGQVALMQGNLAIVELCLQNNKNFEQLTFLYLICGQFEKLRKMMRIAQVRNDVSAQYQSALVLGDVRERVRLLRQCGNEALAELTAKTHGFDDEIGDGGGGGDDGKRDPIVPDANAVFLRAPIPVQQVTTDWPFLVVSSGFFETMPSLLKTAVGGDGTGASAMDDIVSTMAAMSVDNGGADGEADGGWGEDVDLGSDADGDVGNNSDDDDEDERVKKKSGRNDEDDGGWDIGDDDIVVPDDLTLTDDVMDAEFAVTQPGVSETSVAVAKSRLPVDHVAAGSFSNAFRLLHEQIGIVNFEPYKDLFMDVYARNRTMVSTLPNLPSLSTAMLRNRTEPEAGVLSTFIEIDSLIRNLQDCYKSVTEAKFADAISKFEDILLKVPLLSVVDRKAYKEALELIRIACEYITSLKMETERRNLAKNRPDEMIRQCEMAAYFTHCQLQPSHRILTLRTALNLFYKTKNFKIAASFARRLLELGPSNEVAQNARKLLQICESSGANDTFAAKLNYDEHNPFRLCAMTFVPIYRGKPEVQCAFCNAAYLPQFVGCLCNICRVAEIGYAASGLVISAPKFARK